MATYAGKDGTVKIGTDILGETSSWSLTTSVATTDSSVLGDDWEKHQTLQKSWSGQVETFWDHDDAGQNALEEGVQVTLNLQPEGDVTGDFLFTGQATIESVAYAGAKDGLVSASFTYKGYSTLTRGAVA
tara:strand:- start:4598 stop:4987 length:390 start_codon:yes stop_codon:yes gene_type:complete